MRAHHNNNIKQQTSTLHQKSQPLVKHEQITHPNQNYTHHSHGRRRLLHPIGLPHHRKLPDLRHLRHWRYPPRHHRRHRLLLQHHHQLPDLRLLRSSRRRTSHPSHHHD